MNSVSLFLSMLRKAWPLTNQSLVSPNIPVFLTTWLKQKRATLIMAFQKIKPAIFFFLRSHKIPKSQSSVLLLQVTWISPVGHKLQDFSQFWSWLMSWHQPFLSWPNVSFIRPHFPDRAHTSKWLSDSRMNFWHIGHTHFAPDGALISLPRPEVASNILWKDK